MKKAQIWISVIIYTLVAVLALILILNTGLPILNEMKDRSTLTRIKEIMLDLDSHITDIAGQAEGSQSEVSLEIREGEVKFEDGNLIWEIETGSRVLSPRSSSRMGNLIITSNANVKTYETASQFILQTQIKNDTFRAVFNKTGSESIPAVLNTTKVLSYIDFNGDRMDGVFTFSLNDNSTSSIGTGFVEMVPAGNNTNLGSAKVIAHMDSSYGRYDLEFTLDSYSDFLTVRIKNFEPK